MRTDCLKRNKTSELNFAAGLNFHAGTHGGLFIPTFIRFKVMPDSKQRLIGNRRSTENIALRFLYVHCRAPHGAPEKRNSSESENAVLSGLLKVPANDGSSNGVAAKSVRANGSNYPIKKLIFRVCLQ